MEFFKNANTGWRRYFWPFILLSSVRFALALVLT
jgi:hypothetical protein